MTTARRMKKEAHRPPAPPPPPRMRLLDDIDLLILSCYRLQIHMYMYNVHWSKKYATRSPHFRWTGLNNETRSCLPRASTATAPGGSPPYRRTASISPGRALLLPVYLIYTIIQSERNKTCEGRCFVVPHSV